MRTANSNGNSTLNRQTLAFIREGASEGDRHRLYILPLATSANLVVRRRSLYALLGESALDSGLPPQDVNRQIECG